MSNQPYNPYVQINPSAPQAPQPQYAAFNQPAPNNYQQPQSSAPVPSAPPLFEDRGTEGWHSEQWAPSTQQLTPEQYEAFARSPNITQALPSGAAFVPMSVNIPEANCLLPQQVDPRLRERSTCRFDVRGLTNPEVVGCDPRLNADAEEITRFFHLTPEKTKHQSCTTRNTSEGGTLHHQRRQW